MTKGHEVILNEVSLISLSELTESSGFSVFEIRELVALGAFEPNNHESTEWTFAARCIEAARIGRRLQLDFELSLAAVALVLAYRERIHDLEERLHTLECQLPASDRG